MKLVLLILVSLTVGSCSFEVSERIDYTITSVPEEGGIRFAKITNIDDGVIRPYILRKKNMIEYGARKYFDISKDGERLAYIGVKNENSNVFVKNLKKGKATLQRTFFNMVSDVAFSPDGSTIAFSAFRDNSWNIYTIGAETGSAIRQITVSSMNEYFPAFSPISPEILFVQQEIQRLNRRNIIRYYLWSYHLERGILTQYAEGKAPSFLPDGKKIVVNRSNKKTDLGEIWLVDLENGQEYVLLSSSNKSYVDCSVSPDGERIAVVAETSGENIPLNLDIYIVNIDGSNLTQLTYHPGHDVCP
ncbi:MAG: TolB family protein, partial [Candidatus Heimdallarchaeaceae archaeon]